MSKLLHKDLKRRFLVQFFQHKRISLKALHSSLFLPYNFRLYTFYRLSKLNTNSSLTKIRNRCVLTGRSRGIYNYFKISRIMIRQLSSQGLLPGMKKASW